MADDWHHYCLDAYYVASGQKTADLQRAIPDNRAGSSDEIDHRLAINESRALGPAALRRSFTQENLRWLYRECHLRKTRFHRLLARYLRACGMER